MSETAGWSHFDHEADVGLEGRGSTRAEALAQLGVAMTAVITDPDRVATSESVAIDCDAPDGLTLVTDWLNALVFEMATRHMLFGRFDVRLDRHRLHAVAWGEAIDIGRHRPAVEIKGATCTEVEFSRADDGTWITRCVVDV